MANSFSNYVPFVCIGILLFSLIFRRPLAGFFTIVFLLVFGVFVMHEFPSILKVTALLTLAILIAATALSRKEKNIHREFGDVFDSSDICRDLAKSLLIVFTQFFFLLIVRLLFFLAK